MEIIFNKHKGFILSDGLGDQKVDVRNGLHELKTAEATPTSTSKSKSKSKTKTRTKTKDKIEYLTNGFEVLNIAWEIYCQKLDFSYHDDEKDTKVSRIYNYGALLRRLGYRMPNSTEILADDLSSHTTIYGQNVLLDNMDEINSFDEGDDDEGDDKREGMTKGIRKTNRSPKMQSKRGKLTADEKREIRKQAREMKKNAKESKKVKKRTVEQDFLNNNEDSNPSIPKIKQLKVLVSECIKTAQENSEKKLGEMSKVFQIDDVSIYISDLKNLLDDEWLSDSNIGWVYAYLYHGYLLPGLMKELSASKFNQGTNNQNSEEIEFISPIQMLLPTFVFLIANHPDPIELVKTNVIPIGISKAQFIFCPLNDNDDFGSSEGGSHWSLVLFLKLSNGDSSGRKIYTQKALVYDSMFEANATETQQLVNNMARILHNPSDPKSTLDWDIIHIRDSPQQTNGSDCGVYVTSVTSFLVSQLVTLIGSEHDHNESYVDLSLKNLRFSAIDARIWMLSTLLNCLKDLN